MKKLLIILMFIPIVSFSQQYTEVVEIPNKTADQLYKSAKEWFALTFKSSNDVIQLDDPTEKKIIGKGVTPVNYMSGKYPVTLSMYFTLLIQFKDGRYRYDIQQTGLKSITGEDFPYNEQKDLITEEAMADYMNKYFKKLNLKPKYLTKQALQEALQSNISMLAEIDKQLKNIPAELTLALKSDKNKDW
jgi:hypothetical protein